MTRRIMRALKINEISAVDRPAQVHARMSIIKRDVTVGKTDVNPQAMEIDMDPKELQKMIDSAIKAAVDPLTKKNADLEKSNKDLQDQLAKAFPPKKKSPVTDDEPDADDASKALWRPYVQKAVEAALAKAAEIAKVDEVIEIDGKILRKSNTDEATFALMKGLYEKDQLNDFSKRVDAEIRSLPGDLVAKAKALRAISKLSKEDREVVEKMLKAGQEAMTVVTKSIGHSQVTDGSSEQEIEKNVQTLMAGDKTLTKAAAFSKFMETTEGKALYKRSLDEKKAA